MSVLISCLLAVLISFLVGVVLPVFIIIKLIIWAWRYFHKDEKPRSGVGEPADSSPREEPARDRAEADAAARVMKIKKCRKCGKENDSDAGFCGYCGAEIKGAATADTPAARQGEKIAQPGIAGGRPKTVLPEEGKRELSINRVALVYYIDDATRAGQDETAITLALKSKGWPEDEVAEAFHSSRAFLERSPEAPGS